MKSDEKHRVNSLSEYKQFKGKLIENFKIDCFIGNIFILCSRALFDEIENYISWK